MFLSLLTISFYDVYDADIFPLRFLVKATSAWITGVPHPRGLRFITFSLSLSPPPADETNFVSYFRTSFITPRKSRQKWMRR
mmetsp:Transcript_15217/g.30974  ORF Transcript_15217/g.30974 Transcript_15217/m.30974 type:complete len:82 (-) Transcript_15217:158-403(-)